MISQPSPGNDFMHVDSVLKVFDSDWNLVSTTDISEIPKDEETGHSGRPGLTIVGDKIYIVYDLIENNKDMKIVLKEYRIM